jgi:hypothetical protein
MSWDKYLKGYEWADLLALTERPDRAKEPVVSAIWTATEEVVNIANETVRGAAVETRLQATRIRENEQRAFVPPAGDLGPEKCRQVRQVVAGHYDVLRPDPGVEIVAAVPDRVATTSEHHLHVSSCIIETDALFPYYRMGFFFSFLFRDTDLYRLPARIAVRRSTSSRTSKSRRGAGWWPPLATQNRHTALAPRATTHDRTDDDDNDGSGDGSVDERDDLPTKEGTGRR